MARVLFVVVLGLMLRAGALPHEEGAAGLTRQQQDEFVHVHNMWRREVGAPDLRWSTELAVRAGSWAATLAGRGCALRTSGDDELGENLFYYGASGPSASRLLAAVTPSFVVNDWASEVRNYSYARNSCARGKTCGHYTQVVWSRSREVGCGTATCAGDREIWVCNYRPVGNIRGQRPY